MLGNLNNDNMLQLIEIRLTSLIHCLKFMQAQSEAQVLQVEKSHKMIFSDTNPSSLFQLSICLTMFPLWRRGGGFHVVFGHGLQTAMDMHLLANVFYVRSDRFDADVQFASDLFVD